LLEADPDAVDTRELGYLLNVVRGACDLLRATREAGSPEAGPGAAGEEDRPA
jgi:hypothetical protein